MKRELRHPSGRTPRRSRRQVGIGGLLLGAWLVGALPGMAAVGVSLRIPEAETYVIGDTIPLHWRFLNASTQALGFMWEGCCRLNGQLEVLSGAERLATAPPGQALAHMFAKADRLEPGVPKEYETRVADWVRLPGTGTYQLRGTYRGVLPGQFPQLSRGLALWRDAAVSPEITLRVLGVDDYLGQRGERSARRGLRVDVSGPRRLSPLQPAVFRVALENIGREPQALRWPDDLSLWVLDAGRQRAAPAAVIEGGPGSAWTLAPGQREERAFTLTADRFEGEAFGEYAFFVDVPASAAQPRVPSAPVPVTWRWSGEEVRGLVGAAARGAGTGARNAPLKLLRVHLLDIDADLERLAASEPEGAEKAVARRLALAARLKPIHPVPGPVELGLTLSESGAMRWREASLEGVGWTPGEEAQVEAQMRAVLRVKRDLGWDVGLRLDPTPGVLVGRILEALRGFARLTPELAAPPAVGIARGGTNAPVRLSWDQAAGGGGGVGEGGPAVLRVGDGIRRGRMPGGAWEGLADDREFVAWLGRAGGGVRVTAPVGARWGSVVESLEPGLGSAVRWSLSSEMEFDGPARERLGFPP